LFIKVFCGKIIKIYFLIEKPPTSGLLILSGNKVSKSIIIKALIDEQQTNTGTQYHDNNYSVDNKRKKDKRNSLEGN